VNRASRPLQIEAHRSRSGHRDGWNECPRRPPSPCACRDPLCQRALPFRRVTRDAHRL